LCLGSEVVIADDAGDTIPDDNEMEQNLVPSETEASPDVVCVNKLTLC